MKNIVITVEFEDKKRDITVKPLHNGKVVTGEKHLNVLESKLDICEYEILKDIMEDFIRKIGKKYWHKKTLTFI